MVSFVKGGRGKKAPYATTHHRIPAPIKPTVERLANAYRSVLEEGKEPDGLLEAVEQVIAQPEKSATNYEEVRDRILSHVRSDKLKAVKAALDRFIGEISS